MNRDNNQTKMISFILMMKHILEKHILYPMFVRTSTDLFTVSDTILKIIYVHLSNSLKIISQYQCLQNSLGARGGQP